jgi:hypothetical protein
MCKEMPVIPVNKVVGKKKIMGNGGPRRRHKGSRIPANFNDRCKFPPISTVVANSRQFQRSLQIPANFNENYILKLSKRTETYRLRALALLHQSNAGNNGQCYDHCLRRFFANFRQKWRFS